LGREVENVDGEDEKREGVENRCYELPPPVITLKLLMSVIRIERDVLV